MGDNAISRVERAVGSLDDDAWFQDAGTGRAIYVRDLRPLLPLARMAELILDRLSPNLEEPK